MLNRLTELKIAVAGFLAFGSQEIPKIAEQASLVRTAVFAVAAFIGSWLAELPGKFRKTLGE